MPDVKKRLESLAGEPGAMSAAEFAAMTRADYERSGKLVRDAGIKGEQ
jgi:tripartite-type tricarboxylate transporter receptor subunit TctC